MMVRGLRWSMVCCALMLRVAVAADATSQPRLDATDATSRPNIILILADDLGYGDLGSYGSRDIRTPVIDRLAGEGVRCTQFYASTPVCAPTRVSIMTGRYPARTSLNSNPDWTNPNDGLDPSEVTIAETLRSSGYHTGIVGKWHLGYDQRFWPLQQGFDEHVGFISGWADYYTHNYRAEAGNWMVRGNERRDEKGYLTDIVTREAGAFVERAAKARTPFFLYIAYNAPHEPMLAPPGCTKTAPAEIYRAIVEYLDGSIGQLLAALDRAGVADNTLVIFMSDNGAEQYGSNGPLRGRKRSVYEGGIRVPLVARFPGRLPAGATNDQIGISMDLYATFARLAGAKLPAGVTLDGRDMLPTWAGKAPSPHAESPLFWAFGERDAVRLGRWKLVRDKGKASLYDVPADIGESHDLSSQQPERVKDLSKLLDDWIKSVPHPVGRG
jgi:arylsulfatase A-like enzyme